MVINGDQRTTSIRSVPRDAAPTRVDRSATGAAHFARASSARQAGSGPLAGAHRDLRPWVGIRGATIMAPGRGGSIVTIERTEHTVRRKTFDRIMIATGMVFVVVLLVAGSLLTWGSTFISNDVHNQLAAQKIDFPPASAFQHAKAGTEITPSMIPVVSQYAGQEMTTGAQAEVYADHFIAVHLQEIGGGLTYSQLSAKSIADPKNAALAAQVQTVFRGTTLRGLLLNVYAFWQIGQIAGIAALASFILAGVMLLLVVAGIVHLRRTPETAEI